MKNADSDRLPGHNKLLEAVDENVSVFTTINYEFGTLGYHFNGNGNGNEDTCPMKNLVY